MTAGRGPFIVAIALLAALVGCESPHERMTRRSEEVRAIYAGETWNDVVAELGEPASAEEFRMGDGIGEFQIGLYNVFPPGDPKTADRIVREARWPSGEDFLVLWFAEIDGEWRAVDAAVMLAGAAY